MCVNAYDSSKISLLSATDGAILGTSTATFGNDISLIPYTLCWDDLSTKNNTGNGTVATLKFKVLSGATGTAGITIKLNQGSTFNVDLEDVEFKTVNGSVNITAVSLSSIAVKSMPTKTSYFVGDTLNTSGLALTATYNNGTTQTISSGFTCSPTTLNTEGTQKVTVTYSGKTTSFNVTVNPVMLSSIAVKSAPTKTSYFVGDTLNTSGLALTATYNNGTTKTITSGFTCNVTTLNTAGTQNVTVTYSGKTANFSVTVTAVTLSTISVKTAPTKTSYFVGETLDTTGLTLTATYNNGTTKTISSGFTCTPTKLDTAGTQKITVSYGGKTTSFNVTVENVVLTSIVVKTNPTTVKYYVGDVLNTSGLTLTATYNNGTTKTISSGFTCTPTKLDTAGTQKITVTYGGKTTSFNVTVENVVLTSIAVKTLPNNMTYYVGDTLDTTGLTLTATYNNGTTKTITSGFTCTPTTLNTAGTRKIDVTYGGKTTSFSLTVGNVELVSIAVKTNPTKTSYYVGDTLDTTGLTLTATYNNGSTKTISSGFTCTPTTLNTAGTQKITVTYGGKTVTFNVNVVAVTVTSIAIKTTPNKMSYFVGETLDTTGLTITANYNNGTSKTVSNGFTCTPTALNTAGSQKITVTYSGKSTTFDVNVENIAISGIAIKTNPTKTSYYVGDTLDTSGLTLTATYNNGTTKTITSGFTCTPTLLNAKGTQMITVVYGGKSTEFTVNVTDVLPAVVAVKTMPLTIEYFVGDTLSTEGLTLSITYNNGKTETVSSGFTCTPAKLSTAGTQKITVTYAGKSTSFNVNVKAVEISSISVASVPETLSYYVGDTLSTKGLAILVSYNNGKTETVSGGFTCTPTKLSTEGTQKITVSYGGKTTSFNVSVASVKVTELEIVTVPQKTSYKVGDKFDPTGLTMNAVNSKGETIVVTDGFVCTPEILDKAGTQVVTVSYGGKSVMITVVVNEVETNAYTVKFISDNIVISESMCEIGSVIIEPSSPAKEGYKFVGWDSDVPDTMPAYDMTFTAVFEKLYICSDCGNEILGEDAINEHIVVEARMKATVTIKNNNGSNTIKYGETLRLTAITTNMPVDAKIYWYVDGEKMGEGEIFNVSFDNGTKTVEVKIVDSDGNVLKNASGNEIKDSENVTVKGGFFQKIISFFKNLFGMNRTVVQSVFRGIF